MKKSGPPKPKNPRIINLQDRNYQQTNRPATSNLNSSTATHAPVNINNKRSTLKITLLVISIVMLATGCYILALLFFPVVSKPSEQAIKAQSENVNTQTNKLFIPRAGVDSVIKQGGIEILDQGVVWHRLPERGNPVTGGNFILTGHSFVWGYTPQEVTKQSVFYHLAEVVPGDEVIVHWEGIKYTYRVTEKTTVKPNATEVEAKSDDPKLTIYTCTTGGASDGRVVLVATPKQ